MKIKRNLVHSRLRVVSRPPALALLILAGFLTSAAAQEVSIPDPGLNAAIRDALQKPVGPLTAPDLLSLTNLDASGRNVHRLDGLEAARNLIVLQLVNNQLTNFNFPSNLTRLAYLDLSGNQLTNLFLSEGLTNLTTLVAQDNELARLTVPGGLTGLVALELARNQLTNLDLAAGLRSLNVVALEMNQITNLNLPAGLTNLSVLALQHNQLTRLTLPPDMRQLTALLLGGNPFTSLVLSESLAATSFSNTVASLRDDSISVFTYPPNLRLTAPRRTVGGAFEFTLSGPPGVYTVLSSTDLSAWNELGAATNTLGNVSFSDPQAGDRPRRFYLARSP